MRRVRKPLPKDPAARAAEIRKRRGYTNPPRIRLKLPTDPDKRLAEQRRRDRVRKRNQVKLPQTAVQKAKRRDATCDWRAANPEKVQAARERQYTRLRNIRQEFRNPEGRRYPTPLPLGAMERDAERRRRWAAYMAQYRAKQKVVRLRAYYAALYPKHTSNLDLIGL